MHHLLESDWSIVLIMTDAVKQIVEEGRILVTVHPIFSTNNGMQNLISALKTSQPNGTSATEETLGQRDERAERPSLRLTDWLADIHGASLANLGRVRRREGLQS